LFGFYWIFSKTFPGSGISSVSRHNIDEIDPSGSHAHKFLLAGSGGSGNFFNFQHFRSAEAFNRTAFIAEVAPLEYSARCWGVACFAADRARLNLALYVRYILHDDMRDGCPFSHRSGASLFSVHS
jgi:hypothetical protein